jgi:hypothetical protein
MVLVVVGASAPACTSELATSWIPQDVDVTEKVEDLGETAYSLLCDQFEGYVHELYSSQLLVKAACTAHAVRETTNTDECTRATDACLETLPPPVENELESILAQASCKRSEVSPDGCRAPVGELVACLEDLRGTVERVATSATCAAFGSKLDPGWWKIVQPESCIALATRCRPHL